MYTSFMILLAVLNIAFLCIAIYKEIKKAESNTNRKLIGAVIVWSACTTVAIITGVSMFFSNSDPLWVQIVYVAANATTIGFSIRAL